MVFSKFPGLICFVAKFALDSDSFCIWQDGILSSGTQAGGTANFGSPTNFASVLVSQPRLGRVVDALGTPIDGAGPIKTTTRRRVELKVRWVGE